MIDFRYHLVSLIAVFLALTIGIVVGAGPVNNAVRERLGGEVDTLESRNAELENQVSAAQAALTGADGLLGHAAPGLLEGSLAGRNVALVTVGDVDQSVLDALAANVALAGAAVVAQAELTSQWTSEDYASSRQSFASSLAGYLADGADPAGYDATLAHALVLALSGAADETGVALSADADVVREILVRGELLSVKDAPTGPADLYIVVTDEATTGPGDETEQAAARILAATLQVVVEDTEGAVLAQTGPVPGPRVTAARALTTAGSSLSTVTGADSVSGSLVTVLAASQSIVAAAVSVDTATAGAAVPTGATPGPVDRSGLVALGVG